MLQLKLCLLGAPQVYLDGVACNLHSHKALALLAYLVVNHQPQSRAKLATLLWPDQNESRALAYLRHTLWTLRKSIGDGWFASEGEIITLPPQANVWLDVTAFQSHLAACRQANAQTTNLCTACLPTLQAAVDLYRDEFLAGFTLRNCPVFDEWHFFESEQLRQQLVNALQQLVQGYSSCGDYDTAIFYARRWLAQDPLYEPVHQRLMQLYAWSGQRAAAVRQYQECVRLLQTELATQPTIETNQLFQLIQANRLTAPATCVQALLRQAALSPPFPAPDTATLQVATILCAGFTDLWEPQSEALIAAASRMTNLLQAIQPLLDHYGTRVEQWLGDQFLAVFAADQHDATVAKRAMWAAGELQNLARQQGVALSVGLHTGIVLLQRIGGFNHADDRLVMGPVVNWATRLQALGEAGDILVSKALYQQLGDTFQFIPLVITSHGGIQPVTAYLVKT